MKVLEAQLRTVMSDGHAELVRALDPLEKDGAVGRFLTSLREELKGADEDRGKQLAAALAALDANDEKSLISRLASDTAKARQMVLKAVNPEVEGSPMAILKTTLTTLLKEQGAATVASLERQAQRQTAFEKEVREVLARIETKRTQDQKSARGGYAFETTALDFIDAALRGTPCVFDVTTNTVGHVDRCKKGDAVARFTAESAFSGSAVVFEVKRDGGYNAQRALAELDEARRNRDAQVGVFVMAESHASDTFPRFARHGNNVLVVWNEQDGATDPRFHAAIVLALALVSRAKKVGDDGDIAALSDIESRIQAEVERLERMDKNGETIRKNAEAIADEIRKGKKCLGTLLAKAKSTMLALNVELHEERAERATPIAVPNDSLTTAVGVISKTDVAAE